MNKPSVINKSSDIFSFRRWKLLVAKHWVENRKRYGLFLLAGAAILVTWYSFILMMSSRVLINMDLQYGTYYIGLYIIGSLYGSSLLTELSSKKEAIGYLSLPASQLEKLLCVLFFGVLLFFVAYTLLYYIVDIPMVGLSNKVLEKYPHYFANSTVQIPPSKVNNIFLGEGGPGGLAQTHLFLFSFFMLQAVFILGSVYFTRYALIKSIIAALFIFGVLLLFQAKVMALFTPKGWGIAAFAWVQSDLNDLPARYIMLPRPIGRVLDGLIYIGLPVALWAVTYFRLREKEI